jgi:hypothetical protein
MRATYTIQFPVKFVLCVIGLSFLMLFPGCGGSSPTSVVEPPPAVSVNISTRPAGVNAGLRYRFSATVQYATNTNVTWTVACACTRSEIGSIASDGTYTAPPSVPVQLPLIVTATSVADSSKSASLQFTLMPAIQILMDLAPSQVVLGFSHQFSANIQNDLDNRGVQWFVGDVAGGNVSLGTIDSHGVYTAPVGSSEMIIAIVAKSVTDPNQSATTPVTLIVNEHPDFTGDCVFSFAGPDGLGLTASAGTVHLDGAGRLTATLDINSGSNNLFVSAVSVAGYYGFEHNNLGHATLNYTVGQQPISMYFRLAMLNDHAARILEFDGHGDGMGMIEKKASAGLTTSLDGARVLALRGLDIQGQYNPQVTILGAFTGTGGSLSGIYDGPGNLDQTPMTGSYTFGSPNTLSVTFNNWNSGHAVTFRIYPVSPARTFVLSTGNPILSGVIEGQTGGPYTLASFAGTWVYSTEAVDSRFHTAGVSLVRVQADGSGVNATGDIFDNNQYTPLDGPPHSGSFVHYYVAENGRGNANAQFAVPDSLVWYWVTPDRGYIKSGEGYGEFFRQQDAPFTAASLQVPLTFFLHGFSDYFFMPKADSMLGAGTPDGNRNLVLNTSDLDEKDVAEPIKMEVDHTGTYSIGSDGRGVISLDNGQYVMRFLAVSNQSLLLMRPGYDVIGAGNAQQYSTGGEINLRPQNH